MHIDLVPATADQEPIVDNLLQLYQHDFSEIISLEVDETGRFQYSGLPLYWSEPGRFPFLAVVDGKWAGFVFIRQYVEVSDAEPLSDMTEFFVLRGFRRHGIGTRLAQLAFERFPGAWQVRVMEANAGACQFWQRAIENFTGASQPPRRTRLDGMGWHTFRFASGADGEDRV